MKKVKFINSYSFIYSPRPGTPACEMEMIDEKLAKKRLFVFQNLAEKIKLNYKKKLLNQKVKVLFENKMKDEKDKYWNDILDKFRSREGRDCIDRMLQQEWGGRGPQHCYCGYCYYYTVYENGKRIVKRRTKTQLERQSL